MTLKSQHKAAKIYDLYRITKFESSRLNGFYSIFQRSIMKKYLD